MPRCDTGNCSGAVPQLLHGRAGRRTAQVQVRIRKSSKEEKCGGKMVPTLSTEKIKFLMAVVKFPGRGWSNLGNFKPTKS